WKTSWWRNTSPQWFALCDTQESMQIGGYHPLWVHPANHSLVLGVVGYHGAGVLKSVNAGISWMLLGNAFFDGAAINSIAVDPSDVNVIYVGVVSGGPGGGVYKSIDGGQNWINTTPFHLGSVSDLIVARFDGQTLYAGLTGGSGTAGVYKSTKGANTGAADWKLMTGLPSGSTLGNAIRIESATTTGIVYASY